MVEPVTINLRFLARDLDLPQEQVQKIVALLDEGFPVPFIARYRKDQTENMDEENLRFIDEELKTQRALCERKQAILKTIDSLGKLTPDLDKRIREAKTLRRLEDLYLPYKPKKQTLASTARERGLEPLALEIIEGKLTAEKLDSRASEFINEDKKVLSIADALLGAGHIIAEIFGEKIDVLQRTRDFVHRNAKLVTAKVEVKPAEGEAAPMEKTAGKKKRKKKTVEASTGTEPTEAGSNTQDAETSAAETSAEEKPDETTTGAPVDTPVSPDDAQTPAADETVVMPIVAETPLPETPEDSSGSGGGDEEPVVEAPVEEGLPEKGPEAQAVVDMPVEEGPETQSVVETSGTVEIAAEQSPTAEPPSDVQEVTEQFQQWKEAQQEQGIPTVTSQNTLRKKKKAEAKKKKADMKARQVAHFERQFSDYFNFSSGVRNMPPHRILAINRGERVKVLKVKFDCDETKILDSAKEICVPQDHPLADFLAGCLKDSLHRLVVPSMERELRSEMTEYAERHSIRVFSRNLRNLLLQPPLRRKRVLALDPGMRHGCKAVPLDEFGNVLDFETIYLVGSAERKEVAVQKLVEIINKYQISVIAIGNGTGCRETEECVSGMIANHFADVDLSYIIVNEAGASVYSASPIAKEEFPNYDVLLRGAVSIGRRLQDPLNELVKIDPASLGVGMYQHDVKGKQLKSALTEVVESCVNFVGVDLNTATPAILQYVAGLNQLTAKRIHDYRTEHGPFQCREDLKKVSGFGGVAFTHSAGFLKVLGGSNPLDTTWIHPESYEPATGILEKLGFSVNDLTDADKVKEIAAKIREGKVGELASRFAAELGIGLFTARDILDNLSKPGRDPRESLPAPIFRKGILRLEDLQPGMELKGTILNVVDFGAFVDIGLHESGLIHISQMADRYIREAYDRVAVGDIVRVWVVEVDPKRKRISLTMLPPGTERQPRHDHRRDENRERPETPREDRHPKRDDRRDNRGAQGDRKPQGGDRPPRREGDRRDQRGGGRDRRDDRGRQDRGPKTFTTAPKEKEVKPISEDMKKGKEPMRSFGDLAQLLGRVQVPDPAEEKKRKKEEERKRGDEGNKPAAE